MQLPCAEEVWGRWAVGGEAACVPETCRQTGSNPSPGVVAVGAVHRPQLLTQPRDLMGPCLLGRSRDHRTRPCVVRMADGHLGSGRHHTRRCAVGPGAGAQRVPRRCRCSARGPDLAPARSAAAGIRTAGCGLLDRGWCSGCPPVQGRCQRWPEHRHQHQQQTLPLPGHQVAHWWQELAASVSPLGVAREPGRPAGPGWGSPQSARPAGRVVQLQHWEVLAVWLHWVAGAAWKQRGVWEESQGAVQHPGDLCRGHLRELGRLTASRCSVHGLWRV